MSGVEEVALIAAIAGGTTQVAGGFMGASAQAGANERTAALKNMQADEILSRELINEDLMKQKSEELTSDYHTGGGGLGGILRIKHQADQNLINSRRDADFKAFMLRQGADIDLNLSSDAMTASYITGAGTILGLAGNVYSSYKKTGKPSNLT